MTKQDFLRLGLALNDTEVELDDDIRNEIIALEDDEAGQWLKEALIRRTSPRMFQFLSNDELVDLCRLWNAIKRPKSREAQKVRELLETCIADETGEIDIEKLPNNVKKYLEALPKFINESEPFPLAMAHFRVHETTLHYLKKSAIHGKWVKNEIVSTKWKRL
jgi:hypothetical protein